MKTSDICRMCGSSVNPAALSCAACGESLPRAKRKIRSGDLMALFGFVAVIWAIVSPNEQVAKLGILFFAVPAVGIAVYEVRKMLTEPEGRDANRCRE